MKWALAIGVARRRHRRRGRRMARVSMIIGLYNQFFRFPELLFSVPLTVVVGARC